MKAKDVMTHCVVSIGPDASIRDAIARMISHQVSGMPVVDAAGKLVGIITEGDLVRRVETGTEAPRRRWLELLLGPGATAEQYARAHGQRVREVMSPNVVTVAERTPLGEVVRLMEENGIKRIPVVEDECIRGIVSRADLMLALAQFLGEPAKHRASDDTIRRKVVAEMKRQSWCPIHSIVVGVHHGVVEFKGTIFDERERGALDVLARNVEGVKGVKDRLTCVEVISGSVIR